MAVWVPNGKSFYLPQSAVTRILSTNEYVQGTGLVFHGSSNRLLCVGHPFYETQRPDGSVKVPKVSSSQYRVFKVLLPDPNKFVFSEPNLYDPESQRLVWKLRGLQVDRGQPHGVWVTGHLLMNKLDDTENLGRQGSDPAGRDKDSRVNMGLEPKQMQVLIVGCRPPWGEHWGVAKKCASDNADPDKCPAIELKSTIIEDGNMMDTGFGNLDFRSLQENKADAPIDICQSICKYPDFIRMSQETYGDHMFFCAKHEQIYLRHYFSKAGKIGEEVPKTLYVPPQPDTVNGTVNFWGSPSGSMVSSNNQLFNKPYWVRQAQGHNNGVLWNNLAFITVGDTTRGTNFNISVLDNGAQPYKDSSYAEFLRHVEEFDIQIIVEACIVDLTPEIVSFIHQMDPTILDNWNLGIQAAPDSSLWETYRYISSFATKCPDQVPKPEAPKDPYEKLSFWTVDLNEKLSQDLTHFPLGRRYLFQYTVRPPKSAVKRKAANNSGLNSSKRRRKLNNK
ncbi:putative major capsid protein L1 [Ovis aries papillomavirus 3]|uniref:Major capsid protein L1 n=1 Tax=Ovis aries papillomavirus 3 TaxID=634772 RepID=D5FL30_9PAPI|nr:putative major capsid protein L1 [Ovis aries papillomavirus 3]ACO58661.1 putative major capsid protein L1 [Ovis aries papillomavirus 3]